MASDKRVQVTLECQGCKRRNYNTTKSKVNTRERIELKKFCRWCRSHVDHKETRWASLTARPATGRRDVPPTCFTKGCLGAAASLRPYRPPIPTSGRRSGPRAVAQLARAPVSKTGG